MLHKLELMYISSKVLMFLCIMFIVGVLVIQEVDIYLNDKYQNRLEYLHTLEIITTNHYVYEPNITTFRRYYWEVVISGFSEPDDYLQTERGD